MTGSDSHERAAPRSPRDYDAIDRRLVQHAVGLVQAARESGDAALIAQAEAMAMAVGFALASRMPALPEAGES